MNENETESCGSSGGGDAETATTMRNMLRCFDEQLKSRRPICGGDYSADSADSATTSAANLPQIINLISSTQTTCSSSTTTLSTTTATNENMSNKNNNKNNSNSNGSNSGKLFKDKWNKRRLYVKNIQWEVHENALKKFLSKFGDVKKCTIIRDDMNRSKGFGNVEFKDEAAADKALKANKQELTLSGRSLFLECFKEKVKANSKKPPSKSLLLRNNENENEQRHQQQQNNFESQSQQKPQREQQEQISSEIIDNHHHYDQDQQDQGENGNVHILDLPYNVLVMIFSRLCLRDLCIVEQVCKYWYDAARITWSIKQKLVLDTKHIYENYKPNAAAAGNNANNPYGFGNKSLQFDHKCLRQVLAKNFGHNLKHLDLSGSAQSLSGATLQLIAEECPNLTYLNMSKFSVSNFSVLKLIRRCTKLRHVVLANCNRISDSTIIRLFQNCKDLESLDLTNCYLISGRSFLQSNGKLKEIVLNYCENIDMNLLLTLFEKNPQLTKILLKREKFISPDIITYIINNMKHLEHLRLPNCNFELHQITPFNIESIRFTQLPSLTVFEMSEGNVENRLIANLLNSSRSLKVLNVRLSSNLNDLAFTSLPINCPLEEVDMSFAQDVSDLTLERLTQAANSLRKLILKGVKRLTGDGIKSLIMHLPKLSWLDVKYDSVDNSLLDLAIEKTKSSGSDDDLIIYCDGANIDTTEFIFKYPETVKTNLDCNYFSFKHGKLTFEASLNRGNHLKSSWHADTVGGGGLIYFGSSSDDDDDDDDFNFNFNTSNNNTTTTSTNPQTNATSNENNNINNDQNQNRKVVVNHYYEDDEDDDDDFNGDDLAEFEDEDNEMYNELDEY